MPSSLVISFCSISSAGSFDAVPASSGSPAYGLVATLYEGSKSPPDSFNIDLNSSYINKKRSKCDGVSEASS
ncbi:hypothetical protein D3C87_1687840 [compost metagenome]